MEYKLSELASICYGKNQKKVECEKSDYPIFGTGGLMGYASEPLYDKPSVLIGRKGTIDKVRYVTKPFWTVDTLFYTRINEELVTPYYFYCLMQTVDLKSMNEGTTIPSLRTETLNRIVFDVPPLETQRKIASVLSAIDDKIELNERMNKNLEEMVLSDFKNTFIDFKKTNGKAPLGCRSVPLGSICKCYLGGTPNRKMEEYWNGKIPWINSGEVNNFRILNASEYITQKGLEKSSTKLLPKKTVVLAITGATLGQISLLEIETCANQSVIGILPNDQMPYEYLYPMMVFSIDELLTHQTGGAQQHINNENVKGLEVLIPSNKMMNEFVEFAHPLLEKITTNCFEMKRLTELRDSLLPKLMSGEIDVDKIEI